MKESNIHEEFNDDNSPYTKWIAVFGEKSNPDNKDKTSVYRDSKSYDAEIFKIEDYISEGNNLEIKTVPTYIDDSDLLKIYNEAYLNKMDINQDTIDKNKDNFIDSVIFFAKDNNMAPDQLLQAILQDRDSSYFKSIEYNENNILHNSKEDMEQQEKLYKDSHYNEYPHGNDANIKQKLGQYYLTYQNQSQLKELDNKQNFIKKIKDSAEKNHVNADQLLSEILKGMSKEAFELIESQGVEGDVGTQLNSTLNTEIKEFHINQYKEYINHLEATPSLDKKIQTTETEQSVSKLFLIEYLLLKYDINRDYNEKEMLLMDVSLYQKHFEKESTNKITFDETDKELINKVDISIKAQNKTNATVNKMKDSLNSKKAKDSSWFQAGKKMTSSLYSYIKGGDGKSR